MTAQDAGGGAQRAASRSLRPKVVEVTRAGGTRVAADAHQRVPGAGSGVDAPRRDAKEPRAK
jgi:hypothetical protein